MGKAVRNLRVGVNCCSSSICSHNVRLSYSPWLVSKGVPSSQWKKKNVTYKVIKEWTLEKCLTILYVRLVRVQLTSVLIPGTREKANFRAITMRMFVSQVPRRLNQLLFGFLTGLVAVFMPKQHTIPWWLGPNGFYFKKVNLAAFKIHLHFTKRSCLK